MQASDVSPAKLDVNGSSTAGLAAAHSSRLEREAAAAAAAAAPLGDRSMQQQLSLVERAKQHVRLKVDTELGELEARLGVDPKVGGWVGVQAEGGPGFRVQRLKIQGQQPSPRGGAGRGVVLPLW